MKINLMRLVSFSASRLGYRQYFSNTEVKGKIKSNYGKISMKNGPGLGLNRSHIVIVLLKKMFTLVSPCPLFQNTRQIGYISRLGQRQEF